MTPEPPHYILSHIAGRFALLPNDAVIGGRSFGRI
jgi:hypothetical protein